LTPRLTQLVVQQLEPLPLPPRRVCGGISAFTLWALLGCLCFTWTLFFVAVLPKEEEMKHTLDELCGGMQQVVYGVHGEMGIILASESPEFQAAEPAFAEFAQRAVLELAMLEGGTLHSPGPNMSVVFISTYALQLAMSRSISEWGKQFSCNDNAVLAKPDFLALSLQAQTDPAARSCADLAPYCGHHEANLLRLVCPGTCGCSEELNGSAFQRGCPMEACNRLDSKLH